MLSLTTTSFFLGGMAAAAVPVLLHLLMQGKPKKIEFPAVMFLLQKIETHRRNYRLKYILLLILRILLFALMGLALAKPILKLGFFPLFSGNPDGFMPHLVTTLGSQDAPIAAAIVIDTSPRMNYTAENKTRLEEAQEFAQWILRQIPQNSSVAILSCEPEMPVFQIDKLAAQDKVNRLRITPLGRPIAEIVQGAAALLAESDAEQCELYVLTDLSLPGWDCSATSEALKRYDGGIFIVDVGVKEPKNSSFQQFKLVPETPVAQSPVHMDVTVAHTGPATTKTIELVLIGNAHDPAAETVRMSKIVDFPDGESQFSVPMSLTGGFDQGTLQGKLRFSTSDALPMDDQCWFTLSVQPPRKTLIFAQPPVRDSAIFLRLALENVPFEIETKPISELPGMTPTELQEYHAVVLLDPSALLPGTWKKLADYAATGHGVGTFLGAKADLLSSFNHPSATEVLGAKLVRQAVSRNDDIWIMPGTSPIFTPFRSIDTLDRFPWDAQPVFRYWELGELSHQADIAAFFSDNRPAIITQTLGRGCTVMVATPISEAADVSTPWNSLTRGEAPWMFILLAEGIGKHLVGMGSQRSNYAVGEQVVLRPRITPLPQSCLLGTPQVKPETQGKPESQEKEKTVRLTPDPVLREIVVPATATTEPGNYTVRSGGVGQLALHLGFSANIVPGTTLLQRVDTTVLDRHFGANRYKVVRTPQEIEMGVARRRVGQEIYALVMLLLVGVFAMEYIFANRIYVGK